MPRGEADCMLVENACRKLVSPAEVPVPPRSDTSLSNADCSELAEDEADVVVPSVLLADAAVLDDVVVSEDDAPLASDWIRLLTSAVRLAPGLAPCVPAPLEVLPLWSVESLWACDLRAPSSVCMKF